MINKPKGFVDISKVRSEKMERYYKELEEKGICPFCAEHRDEHLIGERVIETDHWVVTHNQWPYENTDAHLLITCAYHAVHLNDLQDGTFEDLGKILQALEKKYDFEYGGFAARFGNVFKTGASVAHLHVHMIIPDKNAVESSDIQVKFKISN